MVKGVALLFFSSALLMPSGFATAVYLSRTLGPSGYGAFALLTRFVGWLKNISAPIFHDMAMQVVAEDVESKHVKTLVMRLYFASGMTMGLGLFFSADVIAGVFGDSSLVPYLQLFAIEVPLFCLSSACRIILTGKGLFSQVSWLNIARIGTRLILIILLVQMGLSLFGAVLGMIGAAFFEMLVAFRFERPILLGAAGLSGRRLAGLGGPLVISKIAMTFIEMDLFALKIMGGTSSQVGFYGAALNLAFLPWLYVIALARTLHSTLSRQISSGQEENVLKITITSIRSVFIILPFALMTIGVSKEIVDLIYGPVFAGAAEIVSVWIFVPVFVLNISIMNVVSIARGRQGLCLVLTLPMALFAIAGHLIITPRYGPLGAAGVTATVSFVGSAASLVMLARIWKISMPWRTMARSVICSAAAYGLALIWTAAGWLVFVKISGIITAVLLLFLIMGEFSADDWLFVKNLMGREEFDEGV